MNIPNWVWIAGGAIVAFFAFKTTNALTTAKKAVESAGYTNIRMVSFYPATSALLSDFAYSNGYRITFRGDKITQVGGPMSQEVMETYYIIYDSDLNGVGSIVLERALDTLPA